MSDQKRQGTRKQTYIVPVYVQDSLGRQQVIQLDLHAFLPRCAASLTACWYLMREDEDPFREVGPILPAYLPILAAATRLTTPYQQEAAPLTAQGYLLSGLLAFHQLHFQEQEQAYKEAILFSDMGKDRNLQVYARMQMASTYFGKDPLTALRTYQQATKWVDQVSPLVRCKWLMELAIAHAQCGEEQEATDCLEKACSSLPVEFENDRTALYADYAPHLCLWEGMAYLNLGYAARDMNHRDHAHAHYQQARNAFAQIDTAQPNIPHMVAGRIRAKILNQQAETALALNDLDACSHFLEKGAQAAKKLQSPLLQQEVRGLWRDACIRWSKEQRLKVLTRFFRKDA